MDRMNDAEISRLQPSVILESCKSCSSCLNVPLIQFCQMIRPTGPFLSSQPRNVQEEQNRHSANQQLLLPDFHYVTKQRK